MPSKRGRGADPDRTRRTLLDAAITTLTTEGYAGATARAIAGAAGCNQASIYYHFGGIHELLVAALVDSNERRMAAYRERLGPLDDPAELLVAWKDLYADDVRSGHIAAMTELLGATGVEPMLRAAVVPLTESWRELCEAALGRVLAGTFLEALVPVDQVVDVLMATVLGMELLGHLDGDSRRADRLFDLGGVLAAVLPALPADVPR